MRIYNKGFSLIELMITVAIVGVLAAIAVPSYQSYVLRAKTAEFYSYLDKAKLQVEEYMASSGSQDCEGVQGDNIVNSANIFAYSIGPNTDSIGVTSICGVAVIGSDTAFHTDPFTGGITDQVILISVANFNDDGSLTWTNYSSTGGAELFGGLPTVTFIGGGGGGGKG